MFREAVFYSPSKAKEFIPPSVAREIVASACRGVPMKSAFFGHYPQGTILNGKDVSGKPENRVFKDWGGDRKVTVPKPPLISFKGGYGRIGIVGLGASGSSLLLEHVPQLLAAFAKSSSFSDARLEIRDGENLVEQGAPQLYGIQRLVIGKKNGSRRDKSLPRTHTYNKFKGKTALDCADILKKRILQDIAAAARFLDEDSGRVGCGVESRLPHDRDIMLEILDCEENRQKAVHLISKRDKDDPQKASSEKHVLAFKDVKFLCDLDLTGIWFVGGLRSHGHGLIKKWR